jgi:hypothetical protein
MISNGVFRPWGAKNTEKEGFDARVGAARIKTTIFRLQR